MRDVMVVEIVLGVVEVETEILVPMNLQMHKTFNPRGQILISPLL